MSGPGNRDSESIKQSSIIIILLKCFGLKYFDETEILNTPGPGNRYSGIISIIDSPKLGSDSVT
jgi:hypothetical protein